MVEMVQYSWATVTSHRHIAVHKFENEHGAITILRFKVARNPVATRILQISMDIEQCGSP
jgi:hypothetical protein